MTCALALEGVVVRFGSRLALDRVTLRVAAGEAVALLGPSGSGKSTVLRCLAGFLAPEAGAVELGGVRASGGGRIEVPPEARGLAMVFQDLALWPHLTVHGNLAFVLEAAGVERAEREDRIAAMLRRVGLAGREARLPGSLSGGEQQRVALARALVASPRAVLLDEPLSTLDVGLKRELRALLAELLRERGTTALHVTHDLREAAALASRLVVLEAGRVVQEGRLAALRAGPATPFVQALLEEGGGEAAAGG